MIFWLAMLLSLAATALVRQWARRRFWVDIPDHRSNHDQPTPTGGGLALAGIIVLLAPFCWWASPLPLFLLGVVSLALVGFYDDLREVAVGYRFLLHLLLAGLTVIFLARTTAAGCFYLLLVFLLVAGLINLYNFMDGIDGLAGMEGLLAGIFSAWLLAAGQPRGAPVPPAVYYLVAGGCAGFLGWNFPWRRRATIFMGDAGSTVLGFSFAFLAALAAAGNGKQLLAFCLPLANFLIDGGLTLVLRCRDGERLHQPHRRHLYQRLVAAGCSHRQVVLGEALVVFLGYLAARALLRLPFWCGWPAALGYLMLLAVTWVRLRRWASRKLMVLAPE